MHISELQHQIAAYEDQMAFKELYMRMRKPLYKFAFGITRNKVAAEEAINDVFTRIWTHRDNLDHIHEIKIYLYTSVRNRSLNFIRSQELFPLISLDEISLEIEDLVDTPEQATLTQELFAKIQGAVNALPAKCKVIFKLIREDGLRYKEVAELLQIQPKTVENQLNIAAKKIRRVVEKYRQEVIEKAGHG